MKTSIKNLKQPASAKWRGLFPLLLLIVVLAVLFWRSFLPDFVHFSNDGPLGMQEAAWLHLPGAFTGMWYDLNSIGSNAGAFSTSITAAIHWILGPVGYAKFLAPIALWILGAGAWFFFRRLKLSPLAAVLGGLAAALNSTFFSTACWGLGSQQIAVGMDFFALGFIVSNSSETPVLTRWIRLALAGVAVGFNVMEAADIGAILSVVVATVVFKALNEEGVLAVKKIGGGIGRVAVVAIFAGFVATQTVVALVGSQITGIAGTSQNTETKEHHWDWATQWSLPKTETLGLFVPGLFGYRMDTPKDMMPALQNAYEGGEYWGGVGRDPAIDRYFDSGRHGEQPPGFMRFTGGGNYLGILVALLAAFAIALSFRRENPVFTPTQKRFVWFWAIVLVGSLLLSWGRFAPMFYKIIYALPYASTIRNPAKFIIVFSMATIILFGYGVDVLSRRYFGMQAIGNSNPISAQLKNWWAKIRGFDRNWTIASVAVFIAGVIAWLIYSSEKPSLVKFLQSVGFSDENTANAIAAFSVGQVGWFLLFFALAVGLVILIIAGIFSGKRARLGGILLGALLIADLGRANLPWIIHWNYKQKYASNPIINFLKEKPYEHRVVILPFHFPDQFQLFDQLYRIEWSQQLFPYYNIQSLDIIQMARVASALAAYENALAFRNTPETIYLITRMWELTDTRYLLGPAGFLETMNNQLDPVQHRFRIVQRFDIVPKTGIEHPTELEQLTAVTNATGAYALFEFTGALPRVKLYSNWQINTNDDATLKILAAKNFDPHKTVLVSTPLPTTTTNSTNQNSGTVEFTSYAPKDIVLAAKAITPSVLLLNDKFDPHWNVIVDGKPAELLRCNYIMRGVYLTPGKHTVEFQFKLSLKPLYVSLAGIAVGILLLISLIFLERRKQTATAN